MTNNKLLSICIPSYNMEKYLSRNLESFLNSTCLDELELIVVNDGSNDDTLRIAKDYKSRYPGTVKVIDKPNGHYGSCVNAALKLATGKYFRIVDADDWVDSSALKKLIGNLHSVNTDAIYTRFSNYREKNNTSELNIDPAKMIWYEPVDLNDLRFNTYVHMHQISYRTQFLKDINYIQTEGICYTDTEYVFKPLIQAKDIFCFDFSLYQYYIGRSDQSMSPNILMKNFSHLEKVLLSITNYPRPEYTNSNYNILYNCYIHALFGMLVDCLFASRCRNRGWNSTLRAICSILDAKGIDLSHYFSFSIKGCHWFRWWYENTIISRFKSMLLFSFINLANKEKCKRHKIMS